MHRDEFPGTRKWQVHDESGTYYISRHTTSIFVRCMVM